MKKVRAHPKLSRSVHVRAGISALAALSFLALVYPTGCAPSLIGSVSGSGAGIAGLTLSPSLGATAGGVYASTDAAARTITFTHNGTSALCSHDGGTTYGACDSSTTMVFTTTEYNAGATMKIKVSKSGYADYIYSLKLGTDLVADFNNTCTSTVSASTFTGAGSVQARLTADGANAVICVPASMTIANSGAEAVISFTANGQKVIGLGSGATRPVFSTTRTGAIGANAGIFRNPSFTGAVLSNIRLNKSTSGNTAGAVVNVGGDLTVNTVDCDAGTQGSTAGGCFENQDQMTITGATITGNFGGAVVFNWFGCTMNISNSTIAVTNPGAGSGTAVTADGTVNVSNTTISNDDIYAAWSVQSSGITTMTGCTVTNPNAGCAPALYTGTTGYFNVSSSTLSAANSGCAAVVIDTAPTGTNSTISSSTVVTGKDAFSLIPNGVQTPQLTLTNSSIRHAATGTDGTAFAFSGGNNFTMNGSGNTVCSVNTATPMFTSVRTGNYAIGTLDLSTITLTTCP